MKNPVTRRTHAAVAAFFFLNGAVFGNWVPRIPEVQGRLGLDYAELGIALLGMASGALLALPSAGLVVERLGSKRSTTWSALAYSFAVVLPSTSTNLATLAAGLVVLGSSNAVLDVGMNAQGVGVERRTSRSVLPYFHAAFSIGTLVGAGSGAAFAATGVTPSIHLLVISVISTLFTLVTSRALLQDTARSPQRLRSPVRPTKPLLTLGVVGFCALLAEGAVADWSAVYLRRSLEAGPGLAAAGYVAFTSTMVIGRLLGVSLTRILGPAALVRGGGVMTVIGVALVVFPGRIGAAVLGFAFMGAALSCVFPLALSAAGQSQEVPTGPAIATVSIMGYTGFLTGPPVIGLVAEASSLAGGLSIMGVLGLVILALGHAVRPATGIVGASEKTPSTESDAKARAPHCTEPPSDNCDD